MSKFRLPSISTSTTTSTTPAYLASPTYLTDDDEEDNLPYPTELPRSDFLKADFDPQEYLSSLRNRHQALEDLRSDLRTRSQTLNQELLDLVNGNYEEFLSLGSDLSGGEDKVESIRVGLLGFARDIEALREVVANREAEVSKLLNDAKTIRKDVVLGRKLLDLDASVASLEALLGIGEGETFDEDSELDNGDDIPGDATAQQIRRLTKRVDCLTVLDYQISLIKSGHPFLEAVQLRLVDIRKTLLLDMSSAIRKAQANKSTGDILLLSKLFSNLNAEHEAVKLFRGK